MADKTLIDVFQHGLAAQKIKELLEIPEIIEGSTAFYNHQAAITDEVPTQLRIFEWHIQGHDDVLIMCDDHAQALLKMTDMPLEMTHMQYPTEHFNKVRSGEIALGLTKSQSETVVLMHKDTVLELLDPLAFYEKQMGDVITRVDKFIQERGMHPQDMAEIMDKLEEEYPASDNNNGLHHH